MTLDELRSKAGQTLGASSWRTVDQELIDKFADLLGDHNWIHVNPEKAAAEGPYGGTIAHGYLTLAMVPRFVSDFIDAERMARMGLNYGLNRVRFTGPVLAGSKVRGLVAVKSVDEIEGGVQVAIEVTVEREGVEKPVCVAEMVSRFYD